MYFLNSSLLLVLPALILFIFLRVIKVNLLIAFISAAIFILSSANIFAIPFITKFALCITLCGFIVLYKINNVKKKILFSIFLSTVLVYTRPEFILTLALTIVVYVIYAFKNKGENKSILKNLLPVVTILLLIFFFNPVSRHRANEAFTQHYAMDIQQRGGSGIETLTDPGKIMRKDFSTDYSISDAFTNNPQLFFEHIWFNVLRFDEALKYIFPFFVIKDNHKTLLTFFYLISLIMLLFLFYALIVRIRKMNFGVLTLIYFCYLLPLLLSIFIFYPRVHYMIFIFAFALIYLSYEISIRINSYAVMKKYCFPATAITGAILIIAVPFRASSESIHASDCTALNTINSLTKYEFTGNINFLAAGPGIKTYIKKDWNILKDEIIQSPLKNSIQNNDVNLILVDDFFLNHPSVTKEKELDRILNDTNFVKLNIPYCTSYLLAGKNILKR